MQMEAILYTLAQKFLTTEELKKVKERMNMTVLGEMILQDGIEEGQTQINHLNKILIDTGRLDDLKRSVIDKDFQRQLLEELILEK